MLGPDGAVLWLGRYQRAEPASARGRRLRPDGDQAIHHQRWDRRIRGRPHRGRRTQADRLRNRARRAGFPRRKARGEDGSSRLGHRAARPRRVPRTGTRSDRTRRRRVRRRQARARSGAHRNRSARDRTGSRIAPGRHGVREGASSVRQADSRVRDDPVEARAGTHRARCGAPLGAPRRVACRHARSVHRGRLEGEAVRI